MDAAEYLRDANGSTLSLVALTCTWCYSPSVGLLHEAPAAARITPQTASTHLAKLTMAGLLSLDRNGRHRYFRLASPKVAEMIVTPLGRRRLHETFGVDTSGTTNAYRSAWQTWT